MMEPLYKNITKNNFDLTIELYKDQKKDQFIVFGFAKQLNRITQIFPWFNITESGYLKSKQEIRNLINKKINKVNICLDWYLERNEKGEIYLTHRILNSLRGAYELKNFQQKIKKWTN